MTLDLRTPARARKSRLVTLLVAATAFVLATPQMAFAAYSPTADTTDSVQGIVYSAVHLDDSGRTIVGGSFTGVGTHRTTNVGALTEAGGADPNFTVTTDGAVYAVAANTAETVIYIGGTFTTVNGTARANLAAVDASTGKLLDWTANTNGAVRAMAVYGDVLYVGGAFTYLNGTKYGRLVALTPSGDVVTKFAPWPDWTVRDLSLSTDGSKVYASGGFNRIGNEARDSAAELLAGTGKATAFSPDTNTDTGLAIDVTPNGKRLFFSSPNNEVYAFDLIDGTAGTRAWTVKGGGDTQAIESTNDEVFIGGHFRNITTWKVKRNMVASLNVTDGRVTPWDPHISGDMGPWVIQATAGKLIVGGDFGWVNRKTRAGIARFNVGS